MKKTFISVFIGVVALTIVVIVAFKVSPYPSAWLIRYAFTKGAEKTNVALEKHVPSNISEILDVHYDTNDGDAFLDVYFPSAIEDTEELLPAIVWIHGGGWVSGSKSDISNYSKILAGKGFTVVSVAYSLAPKKKYPLPVRQTNNALAFLTQNADRFHIDTTQFILAGDSAGAHIAAQIATIISSHEYAALMDIQPLISRSQLAGVLLYCGPYDTNALDLNGDFDRFIKTILWSYSGDKNFKDNPKFAAASVIDFVTPDFPPVFISAGNGDPLAPQSYRLAKKLSDYGVQVDSLFFSDDYEPKLPHEYQFNLDTEAGQIALERSVEFMRRS